MGTRPLVDVLVVDDHPGHAGAVADILRTADLGVLTASTVEHAIDLCTARRFDVVVLDHHVADDESERFLEHVRDLPPVVIVSGSDPYEMAHFQERHCHKVFASLRKPVAPPKLLEVVRAAREHSRVLRVDPRDWL
jgi:DNA-binding NtrC family response regulator